MKKTWLLSCVLLAATCAAQTVAYQLDPALPPLAQKEQAAVLDTLRELTSFDSGSGQAPGLASVADHIEKFAKGMGGEVERLTPANGVVGPNLLITFKGTGKRKILLISHIDTVYPPGTAAARPFRISGNRAIAPGIADDKGGVAVFLHAMKLLKATNFQDFERVTMVFNTDEERGSSGSRDLIREQARAHDVVLSGEPTSGEEGIVLATSGVGQISARLAVTGAGEAKPIEELADIILRTREIQREVPETRMNWTVLRAEDPAGFDRLPNRAYELATLRFAIKGRASHAGVAPQLGINAVVEAAAIIQRVGEAAAKLPGVRIHWRSASGGMVPNIIPERGVLAAEIAIPDGGDMRRTLESLAVAGSRGMLSGVEIIAESSPGLPEKPIGAPQAFASADQRVPDSQAYAALVKAAREKIMQKKFPTSVITVQDGLFFPAFNANAEGRALAELARDINLGLGAHLNLYPRTYGGTDAVWAAQSGKPVVESMGLPGGNYHSSEEEFILIDRIPRRLVLVAEMIRAIARR